MMPLKVRSMVGLIPLFAVETLEPELLEQAARLHARGWSGSCDYRPDLARLVSHWHEPGRGERRLLSLLRGHRMKLLLQAHARRDGVPVRLRRARAVPVRTATIPTCSTSTGMDLTVRYEPAESDSGLFGGNSNWRGPIWFPVNYLLIESLQKFHHYYGDDFKVECPTGSGQYLTHRPGRRRAGAPAVHGSS